MVDPSAADLPGVLIGSGRPGGVGGADGFVGSGGTQAASDAGVPCTLDVSALLVFFEQRGRDLPWRGAGATPWRVLVSEVMLQQTPVVRVVPVFDQWVQRWPDPRSLAAAPAGEAVRAWGRLGYPRRALRLWETAGILTERFGGEVPDDVAQLLALPGVGQYTARAVAAFGFGRRVPVVDVNVRRVLNRVVRGMDDAGSATPADLVLMDTQLPERAAVAARLSAAVMELGAVVCTAAQPACESCPLLGSCRWVRAGRPVSTVRRRPQQWRGTDRQVRGRLMSILRDADRPIPAEELADVWPDDHQRDRCLRSLLDDGLAVLHPGGRVSLPG